MKIIYLYGIDHAIKAVPGNFDFSKTSRRNFFDLDKLFLISRDVDVGNAKSLGWINAIFSIIKSVVDFILLNVAVVTHQSPEISRKKV